MDEKEADKPGITSPRSILKVAGNRGKTRFVISKHVVGSSATTRRSGSKDTSNQPVTYGTRKDGLKNPLQGKGEEVTPSNLDNPLKVEKQKGRKNKANVPQTKSPLNQTITYPIKPTPTSFIEDSLMQNFQSILKRYYKNNLLYSDFDLRKAPGRWSSMSAAGEMKMNVDASLATISDELAQPNTIKHKRVQSSFLIPGKRFDHQIRRSPSIYGPNSSLILNSNPSAHVTRRLNRRFGSGVHRHARRRPLRSTRKNSKPSDVKRSRWNSGLRSTDQTPIEYSTMADSYDLTQSYSRPQTADTMLNLIYGLHPYTDLEAEANLLDDPQNTRNLYLPKFTAYSNFSAISNRTGLKTVGPRYP